MNRFQEWFHVECDFIRYSNDYALFEDILYPKIGHCVSLTIDSLIDALRVAKLPKKHDDPSTGKIVFKVLEETILGDKFTQINFYTGCTLAAIYFPYCDECDIYEIPKSQLKPFLETCKRYKLDD